MKTDGRLFTIGLILFFLAVSSSFAQTIYNFETGSEGWAFSGMINGFDPAEITSLGGHLGINAQGSNNCFCYWLSPPLPISIGRTYKAVFYMKTDIADVNKVPQFRLRANVPTTWEYWSHGIISQNDMSLKNDSIKAYSLIISPTLSDNIDNVVVALDLISISSFDDCNAWIYLESFTFEEITSVTPVPTPVINDQETTFALPKGIILTMKKIPAGSFNMGSSDPGWSMAIELPIHRVNIAYDFYLGKFEVTQEQFNAVMGYNPSYFIGDKRPVDQVSWAEANQFCANLNEWFPGYLFRLPTESEWEYACRAGTSTRFYFGDSNCDSGADCDYCNLAEYAWYCGNANSTNNVGQKIPNNFGLYDMLGNAWEWCQDWYHINYTDAPADGSAWETPIGIYRVVRGGSYVDKLVARCAGRGMSGAENKMGHITFRVAMDQIE